MKRINTSLFVLGAILVPSITAQPAKQDKAPVPIGATHLRTIRTPFSDLNAVAFTPDGKHVVAVSHGPWGPVGEFGMCEIETGKTLLNVRADPSHIWAVAISPDSKQIAIAGANTQIQLWDARTGKHLRGLEKHPYQMRGIAFTPDGKRLVGGGGDFYGRRKERTGDVFVWDAETGKRVLELEGHTGRVHSVQLNADGTRLVTASSDNTVRVWDMGKGKAILVLRDIADDGRYAASISPDGKLVATGGFYKQHIKLWDVDLGRSLGQAIAYAELFWPSFVEYDGCILFAGRFDQANFQSWMAATGGDKRAVEGVVNHTHILDLFVKHEIKPTREQVVWLGRLLREMWQAKVDRDFPGRGVVVSFPEDAGDDLLNYEITVFQAPG